MNESSFGSDIFGDEEPAADSGSQVRPVQEAKDTHNIQAISLHAKPARTPEVDELAEVSFGGLLEPPVVIARPERMPEKRPEPGPARRPEPRPEPGPEPRPEPGPEEWTGEEAEVEAPVEIPSAAAVGERPEPTRRRRGRRGRGDRSRQGERSQLREATERADQPGTRGRRWRRGGSYEDEPATPEPLRPATAEARSQPATLAAAVGQRIAILLDVHELSTQARELDGELAVGRLLRRVGRNRGTIRAVAYITASERSLTGSLRDSGLEVVEVETGAPAVVQIAVDAMAISGRVDCVVLAPAHPALAPLTTVLRSLGLRVETASFGEDAATGVVTQQHITLGEDSLFRP